METFCLFNVYWGKQIESFFLFFSSASSSSKGVVGLDDVMSEVSMVGEKWPHKLHPGHTSCLMYVCYSFPTSFIVRKLYRSKFQWKGTLSNIPHSIFCTYFLRCDQYLGFLLDFTEASQCVCWYIYKWFSLGRIDWEVNGFNFQISFPREYDLARVVV